MNEGVYSHDRVDNCLSLPSLYPGRRGFEPSLGVPLFTLPLYVCAVLNSTTRNTRNMHSVPV